MDLRDVISKDLSIPSGLIDDAITHARTYVKRFEIPKRSGGVRVIYHPSKKLKTVQYWLIANIFRSMQIHSSAMAYRDGVSILDNAKIHSSNKFFLRIDLKNFFPSIRYGDLSPYLEKWHSERTLRWRLDSSAEGLIRLCCFYKEDRLAIGYPSSPIISNIVMYDFDCALTNLLSDVDRYGNVVFTRYADDLIFSTSKIGACSLLEKDVAELIASQRHPIMSVNREKTRFGSSSGGSAAVTGLKICSDGHITIHRGQKDHVRLLLGLFSKGTLAKKDVVPLVGHISFCRQVDPAFYTKLQCKYFKEIDELRMIAAKLNMEITEPSRRT